MIPAREARALALPLKRSAEQHDAAERERRTHGRIDELIAAEMAALRRRRIEAGLQPPD